MNRAGSHPPKVAIVGAGLMGYWHAFYARKLGARIVAVVDKNVSAAARLAKRFGAAKSLAPSEDWVHLVQADVIHVCTPAASHVQFAEEALRSSCHVIVEKPLAPSLQEVRYLIELAQKHQAKLIPVHQFPFQKGFRQLEREMERLGEWVYCEYRTFIRGGEGRDSPSRRELLLEILPHPISLFVSLCRSAGHLFPTDINWNIKRFTEHDLELYCSIASSQFTILISLNARPARNELVLIGKNGTATLDLYHGYSLFEFGSGGQIAKLVRPFKLSASLLTAAGTNLCGRIVRWQPAYPGLSELIAAFYNSLLDPALVPISQQEVITVAAVSEQVQMQSLV